jgi:hypothetical protein
MWKTFFSAYLRDPLQTRQVDKDTATQQYPGAFGGRGQKGAFGAGFINGWSAAGTRPALLATGLMKWWSGSFNFKKEVQDVCIVYPFKNRRS